MGKWSKITRKTKSQISTKRINATEVMSGHIQRGKWGEDEAVKFLLAKGYRILERNWRNVHKEIDIVAVDKGTTVFVEVKSRRSIGDERYDELINRDKQKTLISAARVFMIRHKPGGPIRFDVIFVIGEGAGRSIEHIEDAFDSWG